jgi:hypothetical protein
MVYVIEKEVIDCFLALQVTVDFYAMFKQLLRNQFLLERIVVQHEHGVLGVIHRHSFTPPI